MKIQDWIHKRKHKHKDSCCQDSVLPEYIQIISPEGTLYGGNQGKFDDHKMSGYGCGLIAAADISILLSDKKNQFTWEKYEEYIRRIRKYFLYFDHLGMNGWCLAAGLNILFRRNRMPYFAYWRMLPLGEYTRRDMIRMLDRGIPVGITAGPNFPNYFGKKNVPLYRKERDGSYTAVSSIRSHFVVITAIEGDYMKVSSWGKPYYLRFSEYLHYAKKHSVFFFTNYLKIIPLKRN